MNASQAPSGEPRLYPSAIWRPLVDHSSIGLPLSHRNLIVLHITDGTTAGGAITTFALSQKPNRISAHLLIDQNGTVYQLVSLDETAWHAGSANTRSVGIEHVALSKEMAAALNNQARDKIAAGKMRPYRAMPCTEAQYRSSAQLVRWLCQQMNIPCTREFIRSHYEVDKSSGHVGCCTAALDPDRLVAMAAAQ